MQNSSGAGEKRKLIFKWLKTEGGLPLNFPGLMENSYTRNQLLSVVKIELELRFSDEDGGLSTENQPKDIQGVWGSQLPPKVGGLESQTAS